jgi:hypothetical protein
MHRNCVNRQIRDLWAVSHRLIQGSKGGGGATRGLIVRNYTVYELNGAIKYRE